LNKTLLLEDGRVLALGLVHVRGRESGVALDQPVSLLFEFQDDRVQRVALFTEHESGRMAAGL
jgi:hypothetical protein